MVGSISLALCVGLAPLQQPQSESIYRQVIRNPTGTNGYEEYCRAVDLIRQPEVQRLSAPAFSGEVPDRLAAKRALAQAARPALDLVRAGNRKTVFDPRPKLDAFSFLPELNGFKELVKAFACESYVRFADGSAAGGVASIVEGLEFSHRISGRTLITYLVANACTLILLSEVHERLPHLSHAHAVQLEAAAGSLLSRNASLERVLAGEHQSSLTSLDQVLADQEKLKDALDEGDAIILVTRLRALRPPELAQLRSEFATRLRHNHERFLGVLRQPLHQWGTFKDEPFREEEPDWSSTAPLVDLLVDLLSFPPSTQLLTVEAKRIAQLTLMRAHLRIIQFQWRHQRLPGSLAELQAPEIVTDPLAQAPFKYVLLSPSAYELSSVGIFDTGPIHLRYRRQHVDSGSSNEPPELPRLSAHILLGTRR